MLPGSIEALRGYLLSNTSVAMVGPQLVSEDGSRQISCQTFPSIRTEIARQWGSLASSIGMSDRGDAAPTIAGSVDWISGACILARRETIAKVGGLDESFFLYFEETDWCRRARRAGLDIHHLPSVRIVHLGGGCASAAGPRTFNRRFRKSRRRYFRKHHGLMASLVIEGIHIVRLVAGLTRPLRARVLGAAARPVAGEK